MMIRPISLPVLCLAILCSGPTATSAPPVLASATSPPAADDIAFSSRRDGNWEIYVMDALGQNQRRLTRRDAEDRFPLWSPDRHQIAFVSLVGSTWELWVMDSNGANPRRLATEIVAKSTRGWSSDNRRIVYAAGREGNTAIYVVDVASARSSRLTWAT